MNEILKRIYSGLFYIAIMWFGTKYSAISFHILFILIFFIAIYEIWKLRKGNTKTIAFLYVFIPLVLVHEIEQQMILLMFVLSWTFDTFAYLLGVKFGKHKIFPSISPKKSWEGFAGGFIFTLVAAYLTANYFPNIQLNQAIVISLFLPFTATIGDFIESYYKRKANVKDSGRFIPGHGGMLDRMDSFMITIPVLYIYLKLI